MHTNESRRGNYQAELFMFAGDQLSSLPFHKSVHLLFFLFTSVSIPASSAPPLAYLLPLQHKQVSGCRGVELSLLVGFWCRDVHVRVCDVLHPAACACAAASARISCAAIDFTAPTYLLVGSASQCGCSDTLNWHV